MPLNIYLFYIVCGNSWPWEFVDSSWFIHHEFLISTFVWVKLNWICMCHRRIYRLIFKMWQLRLFHLHQDHHLEVELPIIAAAWCWCWMLCFDFKILKCLYLTFSSLVFCYSFSTYWFSGSIYNLTWPSGQKRSPQKRSPFLPEKRRSWN